MTRMSFRSKRTRAEARQNETTEETNAQRTIIEENGENNARRTRNDVQLSSQNQRIATSNGSEQQSRSLEDDHEDDDEDLQDGEAGSQYSEIPDWRGTVKFDEQEKVQVIDKDGNSKLRGGTILPGHVWSLPPGERFVVPFNDFYQPLRKGGHILVWFLGVIARNGDLCPIGEINWHRVDKVYKADIVALVRQKFVLPPHEIVNNKLLRRVGKAWRNHKCQLKKKHKVPGLTQQAVIDAMPSYLIKDQWIRLVNFWFSPKGEKFSNQGKEARGNQDHYHTTGNKSFAMKRDEYEKKNGRKPGPLEFYEASYKRKDGSYKENSASKDFVETAKALIAERATNTTSSKDVESEVFNELMYGSTSEQDKKYQRVVGYGMGVNYNQIFGVDAEIRRRGMASRDSSAEEVVMLRAQVASLQSQLKAQGEQMEEMKGMHQQMQDQMQDQFMQLTSLLLSKFGGHNSTDIPTPSGSGARATNANNTQVNQGTADASGRHKECSSRKRNLASRSM